MTFQGRQYCRFRARCVICNLVFMLHVLHEFYVTKYSCYIRAPLTIAFSRWKSSYSYGSGQLSLTHCCWDLLYPPPPWVDWFSAVVSYLPRASVALCSVTAWRTMRTHVSRSWATMTGIQSLIFYPCSQLWRHWCFFLASQTCFIWNIISRNGALNTGQPKGNFSGPCELSSSDPCLVSL